MDAFLKSVAEYLYRTYKAEIQDLCLVFPNRRAGVFFNRYLAEMIDKPIWMPHIRTISDIMKEFSGYQLGDQLGLVFDLYQVYKKERKTEETFDEFYHWGEMFLNDFDDIDKYLVDPKQLFQNLADLKEIEIQFTLPEEQIKIIREFWTNIKLHETSHLKEDFVSVWMVLNTIYTNYRNLLHSKGIAYEGMMYRNAVDKIKTAATLDVGYKRFAIIGFNALNECEKELFKSFKKRDIADFFWDYDDYYVNNTWHEAGHFLRENIIMFPQANNNFSHNTLLSLKNIEIVSVPSDIGQAKIIPNILEEWGYNQENPTGTAIVLADEQLLVPVLSSLPENVKNVNVTLGYPLKYTPVFSFFEAIVTLHRNIKNTKEGVVRFYHRDVAAILNHPYVQMICGVVANELQEYIIRFNRVFLTIDELSRHEYLTLLFQKFDGSVEFLEYLKHVGLQTAKSINKKNKETIDTDFHNEYWFTFITSLNKLSDILTKEGILLEQPTLVRVLRKMTSGLSIPFKGEPLAGLQVMGVLETRTIDFENIIIVSTNEGNLPKSEATISFIPYNLRKGFGLPTIEHQDSVYAYYFYRLVQRAKNVAALYNSQGGNKASEMSRFLFQLKYEHAFKVTERSLNFRVSLSEEKDITIPKDEEVMQLLYQYTNTVEAPKYLTPTALNAYLECSLRFYYRYVAKIQEKEDVTEDIEGSMFGKLLHNAMERIYSPFMKKEMSALDFNELTANTEFLEECIMKAFATEFFKTEHEIPQLHGKSLVVKEVLRKYMLRILEFDKSLAPLTPMEFEKTFLAQVPVTLNHKQLMVRLGGKIDRIDKTANTFRVIDYKTGKVDLKFENIDYLFDEDIKKQNKEAFQILLYCFILSEDKNYTNLPIIPGLYGMRDIFKPGFDYHLSQQKNVLVENFASVQKPYLTGLINRLADIFNPQIPFTKVADKKVCEYCVYKEICHR
jgi:hypothetical protein